MTATPARVAVFDLDGTLTRHDTMVPYLAGWVRRHPARSTGLPLVPAQLLAYGFGGSDRGLLKQRLLRAFMGGAARADVDAWTREFVATTLASRLHRRARAAIDAERDSGARLVLLSASVDLYVPAIGTALGFDATICTGVVWNGDRLDGGLATPNRRGEEKARVVTELRRSHPGARFAAYGNAESDIPHLRLVEEPHAVNAPRRLRDLARSQGWAVDDWSQGPSIPGASPRRQS